MLTEDECFATHNGQQRVIANVVAWMQGTGAQSPGLVRIPLSDLPGSLHAFLVILAHIVVLGAAAFWLFQRRDIAGARGE